MMNLDLANNPLFAYLLVILPDEWVAAETIKMKQYFKDVYGCSKAFSMKPHLTLTKFIQSEKMEQAIVDDIEKFSRSIKPFDLIFSGFGHFPRHTVYINILNPSPVVDIVENFKSGFKQILTCTEQYKPIFVTKPHLTIARGMKDVQHEQAWLEWENRKFEASFKVEEVVLLKKAIQHDVHDWGKYHSVKTFPFSGSSRQEEQLSFTL
ncbi:2'-5' RNA ligase family protein [Pedobacter immunditicola]|uniref:2'-5' RNA ligase family protein n=1 Tax=Pedobacter immunditicola TaxID=3133440 RepID=UPI0030A74836